MRESSLVSFVQRMESLVTVSEEHDEEEQNTTADSVVFVEETVSGEGNGYTMTTTVDARRMSSVDIVSDVGRAASPTTSRARARIARLPPAVVGMSRSDHFSGGDDGGDDDGGRDGKFVSNNGRTRRKPRVTGASATTTSASAGGRNHYYNDDGNNNNRNATQKKTTNKKSGVRTTLADGRPKDLFRMSNLTADLRSVGPSVYSRDIHAVLKRLNS